MGFSDGLAGQSRRHKRCEFDPWVRKIPLEKEMATPSSILAWKIPMDREAWQTTGHRIAKSQTRLSTHA